MDNVGLIRYMKAKNIKMETLSAINQDYAWGQDSRADFVAAAGQLYPNAKLNIDLLPKFGAGQYGTEISALVGAGSDVVYSSLWGGDLQAFVLQSVPRGLSKRSQLCSAPPIMCCRRSATRCPTAPSSGRAAPMA